MDLDKVENYFETKDAVEAVNVADHLIEYGCGFTYTNTPEGHKIKVRGGKMWKMALRMAVEKGTSESPTDIPAAA